MLKDASASIEDFLDKYQNMMSILRRVKNVKIDNTAKLDKIMRWVKNEEETIRKQKLEVK